MRWYPKSNQLTDILFIFTWGKMVWGGGLGSQTDPAAAAATKEVGVWGRRRGQGPGVQPVSRPQQRPRKSEGRNLTLCEAQENEIFSKLHRKGSQSPRTQNLSQSRPRNLGGTVLFLWPLDCTIHLSHFKCKWRQWKCKGDGEKDLNCANKIYKISWK